MPPWISVADQLPEPDEYVIVSGVKFMGYHYDLAVFDYGFKSRNGGEFDYKVEYWMRIPRITDG